MFAGSSAATTRTMPFIGSVGLSTSLFKPLTLQNHIQCLVIEKTDTIMNKMIFKVLKVFSYMKWNPLTLRSLSNKVI